MALINLLALGLGAVTGSQLGYRASCCLQPRPFPHQFARLLEHPWRLQMRDPVKVLGPYGLMPGMHVLELGCGSGLYTVEMARQVGGGGLVHAVDVQPEMLSLARARVAAQADGGELTARIRFHHSSAYRLPLADSSVDLALLIAVLSEIPNQLQALREVHRVLKVDGRLVLSDELLAPCFLPPGVSRRWLRLAGFRYGGHQTLPLWYDMIYFKEP